MEPIRRNCLQCGTEFNDTTRSHKAKFCTKLCSERFRKPKRKHVEKSCQVCGAAFITRSKTPSREKFCSAKCRQRFYNIKFNRHHHPPRQLVCQSCGKEFTTVRSRQASCSERCNELLQNEAKKGRLREIWKRDNHRCRVCGKEGGRFDVHHWDGTGETDHRNDSPDNLVSVCASCHKLLHTINYIILDGELCVYGKIFELLGAKSVRVLERSQIRV